MAKAAQPLLKTEAPAFDFSTYTFPELIEIKKSIEVEMGARQAKEMQALRAKVSEAAEAMGVSVEALLGLAHGKRVTRHPRGKQPAKYRGPNGEEWSGRGPSPRWMKPLLVKGKTKEEFLIK
jgi:DNA-binding protein H-NS